MMEPCECQHWARAVVSPYNLKSADGIPLVTNHHENCPHYNDSLMDVYKVAVDGFGACYVEQLQDAMDYAGEDEEMATIEAVKMHREVFENLPEFEGF